LKSKQIAIPGPLAQAFTFRAFGAYVASLLNVKQKKAGICHSLDP
jgi:hypothetical protein